jgi:hypothetical protein
MTVSLAALPKVDEPADQSSSSSVLSFASLTDDLLLEIAKFVPAHDLLNFQCASIALSKLDTDKVWKTLCAKRWEPWPRYRLTADRLAAYDRVDILPNNNNTTSIWKNRYRDMEREATRTKLELSDLQDTTNVRWYLAFILSGVRGEARSEFIPIQFSTDNHLIAPGHPPMPYQIVEERPPPSSRIRADIRGDGPFSDTHYLQIVDFPAHVISRQRSNAEWLIVNEFVIMVSRSGL